MKMNPMNLYLINSPWPIMLSINFFMMTMNLSMKIFSLIILSLSMYTLMMVLIIIMWINNSMNEKLMIGMKSNYNEMTMKMLIYLVMLTESMFFVTFFYINYSFNYFSNTMFNMKFYLNMFKLSLLMSFVNLVTLLTSSLTIMESTNMNNKNLNKSIKMLVLTMILGLYFVFIQLIEYSTLNFNISNSVFLSNFFMLTMFHMIHVVMGTLLMIYTFITKIKMLMSNKIKFKLLCWYWHFVDMIWIFIFSLIYM